MSHNLKPSVRPVYRGDHPLPYFDVVVTAHNHTKTVFHEVWAADYLDNGYIKVHLKSGKIHVFRIPELGSVLAVDKYEEKES